MIDCDLLLEIFEMFSRENDIRLRLIVYYLKMFINEMISNQFNISVNVNRSIELS